MLKRPKLEEIECPIYNEKVMGEKRLAKSPGFKIQIFLKTKSLEDFYNEGGYKGKRTEIFCKHLHGKTCYIREKSCLYSQLSGQ